MQRAEAKLGEFVEEAAREVQNRGRTQKKCSYPKQSLYLSYYIIDCNPHGRVPQGRGFRYFALLLA